MPSTGRVEDKVKPAFGQVVWFKTKGYVCVKEKKADAAENPDLPPRWKKGFTEVELLTFLVVISFVVVMEG